MRAERIRRRPPLNFEGTDMTTDPKARPGGQPAAMIALALLFGLSGCGLDRVTVPGLSGPSELGLSLELIASPDVLVADGASTSAIQAVVRDQNGQLVSGRAITFSVADANGIVADIGTLNAYSAVSSGAGVATVIYKAPARTDFTANSNVIVAARPVGTDFNGAIYRTVRIELRSAEGRLFPPNPENTPPTCQIVVQAPFGMKTNTSILFQTNSSDEDGTILRYFWDFGDGSPTSDKPDEEHHYSEAGSYTVTHIVTDNNGSQGTCTASLTIED